jgi:hypothetical protein
MDINQTGVLIRAWAGNVDWAATVTAAATAVLAWFTILLSIYTKRLAAVTQQPSVVATLEPSPEAMMYFDLHVENEGTAAAFSIELTFNPEIARDATLGAEVLPFRRISVLKSGQKISSFLTSYAVLKDNSYDVSISWKRTPTARQRESITYNIDMKAYEGIIQLGTVQPADELKKLREAVEAISRGRTRIGVETFDARDRLREVRELRRQHAARRQAQIAQTPASPTIP